MIANPYNISVDETVRRYERASKKLRSEIKDNPERAKEILIRAGIAQRSKTDPCDIELVPDLRSPKGVASGS